MQTPDTTLAPVAIGEIITIGYDLKQNPIQWKYYGGGSWGNLYDETMFDESRANRMGYTGVDADRLDF